MNFTISNREFQAFRKFIYDTAGIDLTEQKRTLVATRLAKRLRYYKLKSYAAYFDLVFNGDQPDEQQLLIDLLTTNETYFFREPAHFDFLRKRLASSRGSPGKYRVWSAASSSGEEAYSIAMLLDDMLGHRPWEIVGTDISRRVVEKAVLGHYVMDRIDGISPAYLKKYCLRGVGPQQGTLLIDRNIRRNVSFYTANLTQSLPDIGEFDVIFLRNVLIYFDAATKRDVVARVLTRLRPGGLFFIGHSETLNGVNRNLVGLGPAIYGSKVDECVSE